MIVRRYPTEQGIGEPERRAEERRTIMQVRSLGFLGVRTTEAEAMVRLYRDVLGLEPLLERPGATWFRLEDGAQVHIYGPDDTDHQFFGPGPVVGIVVDDFELAHKQMEMAGMMFIGDVQRAGGDAWHHFRGPDGNIYELMGPDGSGMAG
jgi:catechol 2,3-dioxygenase-like lactoylglutathione lyase family enzyme